MDATENKAQPEVKLYKYRWIILLLVSLLNITNQINWLSYASIAFNSSSYYGVSLTWINAFSVVDSRLYRLFNLVRFIYFVIFHSGLYLPIA